MVEVVVDEPLLSVSASVVVMVVLVVNAEKSVNCASEKVCVTPFDVITVVGRAYTTGDVVLLPGGR